MKLKKGKFSVKKIMYPQFNFLNILFSMILSLPLELDNWNLNIIMAFHTIEVGWQNQQSMLRFARWQNKIDVLTFLCWLHCDQEKNWTLKFASAPPLEL